MKGFGAVMLELTKKHVSTHFFSPPIGIVVELMDIIFHGLFLKFVSFLKSL